MSDPESYESPYPPPESLAGETSPAAAEISESAEGEDVAPSHGAVNTQLSASLRADFEALQNDFEQANAMTVDLQCQLAGKSNEFAQLKHHFEKTSRNLAQLQRDIEELREERHRLANEAMMVTALEMSLQKSIEERNQLKLEIAKVVQEKDAQIAELNQKVQAGKNAAAVPSTPSSLARGSNPRASALITEISRSVEQLRLVMGVPESKPSSGKTPSDNEFINISFAS